MKVMTIAIILAIGAFVWVGIVLASQGRGRARASAPDEANEQDASAGPAKRKLRLAGGLPVAIALMLGISVYMLTGQPGYPGAPVQQSDELKGFGEPIEDPRAGFVDRFSPMASWLAASDGLIRSGKPLLAARLLQQGVRQYPDNLDLWLAYANALVVNGGDRMTPPAALAYERAAAINPDHPGPPFFSGLALASSGDFEGARARWTALLERSPERAPWREDLLNRIAALPPAVPAASGGNDNNGSNPPNPE